MSVVSNKTMVGQLLSWEEVCPDSIFLVQPMDDGSVVEFSWSIVARQVRHMASHIASLNLPPKSNIVLLSKNSAYWIMADLAIMMAGHVCVPIYPTLDGKTAQYIVEHCEARLLLIGGVDDGADGWPELWKAVSVLPLISLPSAPAGIVAIRWEDVVSSELPLADFPLLQPDDLATIVYTSGSTGRPKGVMHSHRSMLSACEGLHYAFEMSAADRLFSYLPLAHAAERCLVETCSLFFGSKIYFNRSLETFNEDIKLASPTIFFSVPRLWTKFHAMMANHPAINTAALGSDSEEADVVKQQVLEALGLQNTRVALTGSAPTPIEIVEWYRKLGLEMLDCYGMSENFAMSHRSRLGHVRAGYVGEPAHGVDARLSPSGEVEVKSPCQMLGYYKMPEQTQADMTDDGFFKTGDLGEVDSQQRLKITGRVKDIFKTSKGKYVAPLPIEQALAKYKGIESVCVMGSGFPQTFAVIVAPTDGSPQASEAELSAMVAEVNKGLEAHEKLSFVVITEDSWTIENGFLTPTLKIKRNVLEGRYLAVAGEWFDMKKSVIFSSQVASV